LYGVCWTDPAGGWRRLGVLASLCLFTQASESDVPVDFIERSNWICPLHFDGPQLHAQLSGDGMAQMVAMEAPSHKVRAPL
jgi:hypothetical protein